MDNYGSQYPYPNPYHPYPPHFNYPNHPPPHNYPPYQPYNPSPPYAYPPQYPPPPNYHHYNNPPPIIATPYPASPYPNNYPYQAPSSPTHQRHGSFPLELSQYHFEARPEHPLRVNSFSSHQRVDDNVSLRDEFPPHHHPDKLEHTKKTNPSCPSIYPPPQDAMSNLRVLNEQHLSPPSSPSSSVQSQLQCSSPTASRFERSQAKFYGCPNDSFSGSWEENYTGGHQIDASNQATFLHSGSFSESKGGQNLQIMPLLPYQKGSAKLLLHGNLDIWVYSAQNLPNMDMFHKTLGEMFGRNMTNKIEGHMKTKNTSDPYVTILVANAVVGRTFVINDSENPIWMQHFHVPVAHYASQVLFMVKDSDIVGSEHIGTVSIPVEQIYQGGRNEGSYPILNAYGKACKPGSTLHVAIQYIPIEKLSIYHKGVGAGPEYEGVPQTYFPLRRGGTVTLYQDAHVPDGLLQNVTIDGGKYYGHGKCWHDVFDSIRSAKRLIYITGWSVWHKVRLIRDASFASNYTLGELLRSKSQEGVRVLLLIWDDPTSRSILGYKTDGVMATHDEETRRFFKHSSVKVLLCPRVAAKEHSWIQQKEVGTIYTHHQKTVILDADAGNGKRKIVAFVGGLDLCDGRYDTPQHPLFRTLETTHKDDYHNPTYSGSTAGCPREPWHDLHSRIDGPAAYDVLTNFEERWLRASKPHGLKKLKATWDDALLRIERLPDIYGMFDAPCISDTDPQSWHVQIFRSIDSSSVKGFPKDPKDGPQTNLVCGKNVLIDMSIHSAYVKAIRSAQHFIYIENQYFIGSSYNWGQYKDLGANNLIPMEIALKIASKIRTHERFAAYIVVPMWPEGVPTGNATQRILFWQHKTMQMMYETIYKALVEVGLEDSFTPQDFLIFFCLGNREAIDIYEHPSGGSHAANTPQAQSRKSRRFMIYVHSKGMIVDDEYIIIGSANINQRSMEGTRDTEIAMGAYQPHHTWAKKSANPNGQIYGYRMSLWAEHIGALESSFEQPESIDCVRRVRSISEENWKQFAAEEITEMRGHLLKYPVDVDRKGKVKPLYGSESFPDVGGNIVGSFLGIQENLTI